MPITDIRPIKTELRQKYRSLRQSMPPEIKEQKDEAIAAQVRRLWQYQRNSILLIYVSTSIEVDTFRIIRQALEDGKRVAVPRCVPDTRLMEFYYIESLDDLKPGAFGVLEPAPDETKLLTDLTQGLCLVPALCYDLEGFRLGYGKGYYDRFLCNYECSTIGLCYSVCTRFNLIHGKYDRRADIVVTEKYVNRTYL